jgi:predicted peptidase
MRAILVLTLLLGGTGLRAEPQTHHIFETTVKRSVAYPYLRFLPNGYNPAGDRHWPLLLFLHGAGERGTDGWLVAKHGPPKLVDGGANLTPAEAAAARQLAENFIIISPQCAPGEVWDDAAVLALLAAVRAELKVDRTRVYLTGLSMGGYGTWSLAMRHPELFAAIIPICGGGRLLDILISRGRWRESLQMLGVWAFHGAKDPTVPVSESGRMIEALRRAGARDVALTVYPEARHDSWTETYANPELYAWLLRHARTAPTDAGER